MEAGSQTQKTQTEKRLVPAGLESNLLSKAEDEKKLPTTQGYSSKTKIYSPSSRSI